MGPCVHVLSSCVCGVRASVYGWVEPVSHWFEWDWWFIGASFGVCLVARALSIFPLCVLANACWRRERVPRTHMLVMWFAGLRGAIAFALALNARSSHADVLRAATLATVLCTTLVRACPG